MVVKSKRGFAGGVAKWAGLQIASQAAKYALGLPAAVAAVTGTLTYLEGLPLGLVLLGVVVAAAATSVLLNQARVFMLAYSPRNKVIAETSLAMHGTGDDGISGYGVVVFIRNTADVPMEFLVTRQSAEVSGMVARAAPASMGDVIEPGGARAHMIGIAPCPLVCSGFLSGSVDITFDYGRPGKLAYEATYSRQLRISTDAQGLAAVTNPVVA